MPKAKRRLGSARCPPDARHRASLSDFPEGCSTIVTVAFIGIAKGEASLGTGATEDWPRARVPPERQTGFVRTR